MMAVKKLNFNIKDYRDFQNKIEYIVVKEQPPELLKINLMIVTIKKPKKIYNSLKRENYQRNQLERVL